MRCLPRSPVAMPPMELLKAFANSCKFDVFLNACRLDYVSSEWVEGSKKAMGEVFKKINSMKQIWMDKVRVLHHDTPDVLYSKYIVRCSLLSQTTRRSGRRLNRVQRIIMGCHRNWETRWIRRISTCRTWVNWPQSKLSMMLYGWWELVLQHHSKYCMRRNRWWNACFRGRMEATHSEVAFISPIRRKTFGGMVSMSITNLHRTHHRRQDAREDTAQLMYHRPTSESLAESTMKWYSTQPPEQLNPTNLPSCRVGPSGLMHPYSEADPNHLSIHPLGFRGCFWCGSKYQHENREDCPDNHDKFKRDLFWKEMWIHKPHHTKKLNHGSWSIGGNSHQRNNRQQYGPLHHQVCILQLTLQSRQSATTLTTGIRQLLDWIVWIYRLPFSKEFNIILSAQSAMESQHSLKQQESQYWLKQQESQYQLKQQELVICYQHCMNQSSAIQYTQSTLKSQHTKIIIYSSYRLHSIIYLCATSQQSTASIVHQHISRRSRSSCTPASIIDAFSSSYAG